MARVMYLDCFSGAAGDMLLGALIDAGVPIDALRSALGSLGVGHELRQSQVLRSGISATYVEVLPTDDRASGHVHRHDGDAHTHPHDDAQAHPHVHGGDGHRSLHDIEHVIEHSALSASGKRRASALFNRLGQAEAAIHQVPIDQVHFHEVGAVDSIVDIVGVVVAMEWLGIEDVVSSPLNVGGGTVRIAHGTFPVPAPATARLLTGVPIYSAGPQVELVTPTGALLVSDYAKAYGPIPAMAIARIGYGAGTRDFQAAPNVVRVLIGERAGVAPDATLRETVVKIECEIDDMNPQWFGPAVDRLFDAGALDVFLTAVQMKKGRPGTLVTVLAPDERRGAVCDVLFRETTTIGVRFAQMAREVLDRRWVNVGISGGVVRIKIAERGGVVFNAAAEFEDCLRIAEATGRPVKDVQAEAIGKWTSGVPGISNT
jgi:uncharacterized protein (TIGR00299 family) protein